MNDIQSLSHSKWRCQYHIVFIPKYRQKRLLGKIKKELQWIIKRLCSFKDVEIIAGAICSDHVHLDLAIPPKLNVSQFMGYLKGKSALMIYDGFPKERSKWDKSFWARGYYIATVGTVTEEVVRKYIQEQYERSKEEEY